MRASLTIGSFAAAGFAALALAGCGGPGDDAADAHDAAPATNTASTAANTGSEPAAAEPAAAPEPAEPAYDLSGLPEAYQSANVSTGGRRFVQCRSCHQIGDGSQHSVGPDLHGVFGRTAGTIADFPNYSDALKASGIVWDAETIDAWIANPKAVVADTNMTYVGLRDPNARRDLIAWLWVQTQGE